MTTAIWVKWDITNSIYLYNTFCSTCAERRPLGTIYCPVCGRKVRTRSFHSKK
ncbi:hypothetical protein NVIE_1739 [Nitrososphaera viennensis EN76]|uniref:Uncharacterized protein n=1 Tax=Nitrososphaera viennensis EN76 TaxID=926571 RepID=A0A060HL81_9ARCH|nr:hypothetical protein NVIE_1739 [Nitrososphaera viennensis EN76]